MTYVIIRMRRVLRAYVMPNYLQLSTGSRPMCTYTLWAMKSCHCYFSINFGK